MVSLRAVLALVVSLRVVRPPAASRPAGPAVSLLVVPARVADSPQAARLRAGSRHGPGRAVAAPTAVVPVRVVAVAGPVVVSTALRLRRLLAGRAAAGSVPPVRAMHHRVEASSPAAPTQAARATA